MRYPLLQQKNLCHSFLSMLFPTWFTCWPMTQTSQNHRNMISSKTSKSQSWFCYCDPWYKIQKQPISSVSPCLHRCLWFMLEVLMTKNENNSHAFLRKMVENIKLTKDAQCADDVKANEVITHVWSANGLMLHMILHLYQMVEVVVFIVSCCNCRSCTSSAMSHSSLSPTKALRVIWILPKNLSCPPNSSSYKTRQCTLGRSFKNWCIEDTWTAQKYKFYDDQLVNGNTCLRPSHMKCFNSWFFFPPNSVNRISKMTKSICQQRWDSCCSLER